jgi:hypothetical protein
MANGTAPGPLGFIVPSQRTQQQQDAHAKALAAMPRFAMPAVPTGPVKVILTEFLKDPAVIADIGFEFNGFRQLTGSCVGVSAGNAITTLSAVQRLIADNPTQALAVFWGFPYGRTRYNEGDRGQGEGAVDSVMGETLHSEGVFDINQPGLPTFNKSDGLAITSHEELQWSDGGRVDQKWKDLAKQYPVGTIAPLSGVQDIKAAIINGYPVLDGCDNYIGHGSIQGSGADACAVGKYDGRGGHSTCYIGYWDHPSLGPLYLYWNQWGGNTYPNDQSGKPRCSVWVTENIVANLFRTGGDRGETMALSHLNYKQAPTPFPPQPRVIDWLIAP